MKQAARYALLAWLVLAAACTSGHERASEPSGPSRLARFTPQPVPTVTEPAANWFQSGCSLPLPYLRRFLRGYYPHRSPDVVALPREPNFFGAFIGQSHSGPWPYVQHVPLVFYGPGFVRRRGDVQAARPVTLADVAPTVAKLLHVHAPPGDGRPIPGVLLPSSQRPGAPRLIVTIVWDGGGWNVLDAWPDQWPHLADLMREGASVQNVTAGSSPSVTPAVHSTLGTGSFPDHHGVVGIPVRIHGKVTGAFPGQNPENLLLPTLADAYDLETGNAAKVGLVAYTAWHLGMMGHGAYLPGADKDIAVIAKPTEDLVTNHEFYSLPSYMKSVPGLERDIERVDLDDGRRDWSWMGNRILKEKRPRHDTPAWILYQTTLVKKLLQREEFGRDQTTDLFFTNYKQIDDVGHDWNMLYPEMQATLRYADQALGGLTRWLNQNLGAREWVIVMTADHGQAPDAQTAHAWPISMSELTRDLAAHFDIAPQDLIDRTRSGEFWLNHDTLRQASIRKDDVADFMVDYRLEDNVQSGGKFPSQYHDRAREPIFSAAFPSAQLPRIWKCAQHR